MKVLVAHLCPTPCDPMDYSRPGSSVHGILQARILEWIFIPSRGSSPPKDRIRISSCRQILDHLSHQGSSQEGKKWEAAGRATLLVTLGGSV